MALKRQEQINTLTHLAGAVLMPLGTVWLVLLSWPNPVKVLVSIIYGLCAGMLFLASALYHAHKTEENSNSLLRKLDHISIFFMIAGTYTPVCVMALPFAWAAAILGLQWGLVLVGTISKLLWIKAPRWFTTGVYIGMGWVAVFALRLLFDGIPLTAFVLMLCGGVAFSIGAVIYALKRPNPVPGFFGFHEIFHLFILLGALLHYWMVLITIV